MREAPKAKVLSRIDTEIKPMKFFAGALLLIQAYILFIANFENPFLIEGPIVNSSLFSGNEGLIVSMPLEYLVALYLFIAGLITLFKATILYEIYRRQVANEVNILRWIHYALTFPLMLLVVASLMGISNALIILSFTIVALAVIYLGYRVERAMREGNKEEAKVHFTVATILLTSVLAILFYYAIWQGNGPLSQASKLILLGGFTVLMSFFPVIMWAWLIKFRLWREYINVEFSYTIASFLSKTGLAALVSITLLIY